MTTYLPEDETPLGLLVLCILTVASWVVAGFASIRQWNEWRNAGAEGFADLILADTLPWLVVALATSSVTIAVALTYVVKEVRRLRWANAHRTGR